MQQSAINRIIILGSASDLSTDLPSLKLNPASPLKEKPERPSKKIFNIEKVKRISKTAKEINTCIIDRKDIESTLFVTENKDLVNRLFLIKNKYKSSLISMKVVI
jgi:hypothetical protein